jgi:F420-0:gamma-glutamyl ligase
MKQDLFSIHSDAPLDRRKPPVNPSSSSLQFSAIQTRVLRQGESVVEFVVESVDPGLVREGMILAITSKIVSLSEGNLLPKESVGKAELITREAEVYLGEVGYGCHLTVKHGLFILSAGIDESNSERGDYILYPANPFESARRIWASLRDRWSLKNLGIILTDSHTTPLRKGVVGISLAHWGFRGVRSMIGNPDLFGRNLKMTQVNVADALAVGATLQMGEGAECRPLCVISGAEVDFVEEIDPGEIQIPPADDLYFPFFKKMAESRD